MSVPLITLVGAVGAKHPYYGRYDEAKKKHAEQTCIPDTGSTYDMLHGVRWTTLSPKPCSSDS